MNPAGVVPPLAAAALAPLLVSVINRTKAFVGGRKGPPLLQPYRDLRKLLAKGAVFSTTTTWIFRAAPVASMAALSCALALVPLGGVRAPLAFTGDFLVLAGLLAVARLALVLAALDTGSSFEGMGASREALISALAEPAFVLCLAGLARASGAWTLSDIAANLAARGWGPAAPGVFLAGAALLVVLLAECSRIPVDDPSTHLELTMIHEVLVLDHGGPDLALLDLAAALKLWILASLAAFVLVPVRFGTWWSDAGMALAAILAVGLLVGLIEASMARLRMTRLPHLIAGTAVLAALSALLIVAGAS